MPDYNAQAWADFANPEYRDAYVAAQLDSTVAMQIKANRELRQWTQTQLAERAGMKQSRISMMEDVDYSSWSISTLKRLAAAFECGLEVRFVPIRSVIDWSDTMSLLKLRVLPFDEDRRLAKQAADRAKTLWSFNGLTESPGMLSMPFEGLSGDWTFKPSSHLQSPAPTGVPKRATEVSSPHGADHRQLQLLKQTA